MYEQPYSAYSGYHYGVEPAAELPTPWWSPLVMIATVVGLLALAFRFDMRRWDAYR